MPDVSKPVNLTPRHLRLAALLGAALVVVAVVVGTAVRWTAKRDLGSQTDAQAVPTVSTFHPTVGKAGRNLTLPGTLEAWSLARVYARTSGYLKGWYVDIGTKVKEGQLLAEIDAPELDQQLAAARANLATAEANRQLAATTAERWKRMVEKDAVSKQEADEKVGDLAARSAMANAARADVERLQALEGFKRLVAPFDGDVTTRSTEQGALINTGGTTPLFTVADLRKMRVYVHVPQIYSTSISTGMVAELTLPEYPGRKFRAQLERMAKDVNGQSGTVLVQLTVDNTQGLLKNGAYVDVNFTLPVQTSVLRIPSSALIFRKEGLFVATVDAQSRAQLKAVTVAQDLGSDIDISEGITAADTVIDNPAEAILNGDEVRILDAPPKAAGL